MLRLGAPAWELVLRSLVIYFVFFLGLRLFGKRQIGQFTLFDLVLILLVANAVQPAITGPDNSVTGGIIIIATLLLVNRLVAALRQRFPLVRRLLEGEPTVVARDGRYLPSAMAEEGLDLADLELALREHGFDSVKETTLVTLETDGSLSVVGKDGGRVTHRRRRVRFLRHN